jgi:hypothetical protein
MRQITLVPKSPHLARFVDAAQIKTPEAGEILGLKAENIDLQTKTLNIKQSAWRGKVQTVKNTASRNH